MKRFLVLGLIFGFITLVSFVGCKKAEQPAEAPKPVEQAQAPVVAPLEDFKVTAGTLEKGGLGYILSSDKNKMAIAMKKIDTPFKNNLTIKGRMKASLPAGTRNGVIVFGDKSGKTAQGVIFIGGKTLAIQGPLVQEVKKPQQFDQAKVFDTELIINLGEKTVTWKVDGTEVKTKMKSRPASINYVGYSAYDTKTEFSDLQISGE